MDINYIKTKNNFHKNVTIKQADNTSPIELILCEASGKQMTALNGEATVTLLDTVDKQLRMSAKGSVREGILTFFIEEHLRDNKHNLEVTIGGRKFPSDGDFFIEVTKTHDEIELEIIESMTKDEAISKLSNGIVKDTVVDLFSKLSSEQQQNAEIIAARNGKLALKDEIDFIHSSMGDDSYLPAWLQGSIRETVKMHDNYIRQTGYNLRQPPYNLKADGITDETLALQQALDSMPAGANVYLPNGNYIITDTIYINKPLNLTGQSAGENGGTNLRFNLNSKPLDARAIIIKEVAKGSKFRNLYIRNYDTANDKKYFGIASETVTTGWLTHVSFANVWAIGFDKGFYFPRTYLADFYTCYAVYNKSGFDFPGFSTSLKFIGCYANSNELFGYKLQQITYSSMLSCAGDSNGVGYQLTDVRGLKLMSCGCELNKKTGINLTKNNVGISIDSCFFVDNGSDPLYNWYGTAIHIEKEGNEQISITNCTEERIASGGNRNASIVHQGDGSVNQCKTVLQINVDGKFVSVNGQYISNGPPVDGYHHAGKFIWNRTPIYELGWLNLSDGTPGNWRSIENHNREVTWIPIALMNGFTGKAEYTKDSFGNVTIKFNVTAGQTVSNGTQIASLPINLFNVNTPIPTYDNTGYITGLFFVHTYNGIVCGPSVIPGRNYMGQISFRVSV
ncbi:glycosyl hydrolase family 28-related protein [Macrococcus capreoli]|uniref:glycosyl hydrolase family 28-related protein n=1 Tax=Macrococcus capreoli TaxID=2982690 RepID=UPI003EE59977